MRGKKVLIVEDDRNIAKLVKYNLEKDGFTCCLSFTGEEALEKLYKEPVDLIILDIMLPEMDGFETCKRIKRDKELDFIPVIILTAKGEEIDRVIGFELGAEDYVVKPFSPRELVLRVKAVLKRNSTPARGKSVLTGGLLSVDLERHKVKVSGEEVLLTPMEFNLLVNLMNRKGRVASRDSLLNAVWDISSDVSTRTIDTHIKRLRQKLGLAGKFIETVRGVGYRFSEEEE